MEFDRKGEFPPLTAGQIFSQARQVAFEMGAAECSTYHLLLVVAQDPLFQLGMQNEGITVEDLNKSYKFLFNEEREIHDSENPADMPFDPQARTLSLIYENLNPHPEDPVALKLGLELVNPEHPMRKSLQVWDGARYRVWEQQEMKRSFWNFLKRKKSNP